MAESQAANQRGSVPGSEALARPPFPGWWWDGTVLTLRRAWVWLICWQIGILVRYSLQILFPINLIPALGESEFCIELELHCRAQAQSVIVPRRRSVSCSLGQLSWEETCRDYPRAWVPWTVGGRWGWEAPGQECPHLPACLPLPPSPFISPSSCHFPHMHSFSSPFFSLFFNLLPLPFLFGREMQDYFFRLFVFLLWEMSTVGIRGVGLVWACLNPGQSWRRVRF